MSHLLSILKDTTRQFTAANGFFLSAGLSFYVLLYCFPLLLLFLTGLGYTVIGSDRSLAALLSVLEKLLPVSERAVMETVATLVANRGLVGLLALVSFAMFGTFLFAAIRHVLNTALGISQRRTFLQGLGSDLLSLLGTGGLLIMTAGLAATIAFLFEMASSLPLLEPLIGPGWFFVGSALGFIFTGVLFYLLYRVAPARRLSRRALLAASATGATLLQAAKWLFERYVEAAGDYAVLYGALGGLVFFLMWIYYASSVFVLSATLASALDRLEGQSSNQ